MGYIAPRTWTAGEVPTASHLNQEFRDNLGELAAAKLTAIGDLAYATGVAQLTRLGAGRPRAALTVHPTLAQPYWLDEPTPWIADVWPYDGWGGQTSWSTRTSKGELFHYGQVVSTSTQNAEIWWYVVLGQGTWTLTLDLDLADSSNVGVITVLLDGVEVASLDQYGLPTATYGSRRQLTGISVAASGRKKFALKIATKNPLSSGYYCGLSHAAWLRTS